jgi:hypothetical protein
MTFQPLQTYRDDHANTTQHLFASAPSEKLRLNYICTSHVEVSTIAKHVEAELMQVGRTVYVVLKTIPPKDA